jgi:tetratricopeptide (TPR) repeat protein
MNQEDQHTRRIEDYLGGTMTREEARAFEGDLQQNPRLAESYRDYKRAQAVIESRLEQGLRQKMTAWEKEKRRPRWLRPLAITVSVAASLLLIFGLFQWFGKIPEPSGSPQELALRFYEAPPAPERQMGENLAVWQRAVPDYEEGRYREFIEIIAPLDTLSPQMKYYLAHSYFQTGQYEASIPLFSELAGGNTLFNRRAAWYEVLARLAAGQGLEAVENQLREMAEEENHPRHRSALQLLKQLEGPG